MKISYGKKFSKQYEKAPTQIQNSLEQRIRLFIKDPFNPLLNNHTLTGKLLGYRSINISGDWRAIYREFRGDEGENKVIFELLGTHSQLYG